MGEALIFLGALAFFALLIWLARTPLARPWRAALRLALLALALLLLLSLAGGLGLLGGRWVGTLGLRTARWLLYHWGLGTSLVGILYLAALALMPTPRMATFAWKGALAWLGFFFLLALWPLWQGEAELTGVLQGHLAWYLRRFLGLFGGTVVLLFLSGLTAVPLWPQRRWHRPRLKIPRPSWFRRRPPRAKKKATPRTTPPPPEPPVKPEPEEPEPAPAPTPRPRKASSVQEPPAPPSEPPPLPGTDALMTLLERPAVTSEVNEAELEQVARQIEEKLQEFKASGRVVAFKPGPVVTRYEFEPDPGVKISRVVSLADDLALKIKTSHVRIVAPLPDTGRIGIEIPNKKRKIVYFSQLAETPEFRNMESKLGFVLGVDTSGHPVFADLARMPHLLIAGATGSGKSVCINTILTSILFRATPREVRFLLIDPKRIELSYYEGIPHLLVPVVKDREQAVAALNQAVRWMELRYRHFAQDGVRDIESHNRSAELRGDEPVPYLVIIIDEFADLILSTGRKVEEPLARLAQMARAVGIHLVVATQRPSVDVITGIIKANFPVRIAFKVPSKVDSRTILDEMGAEKLLGRGDMLFIPPGASEPTRIHGAYISEEETKRITRTLQEAYLQQRFLEVFGPGDWKPVVRQILEAGHLPALTRDDEPGGRERMELVARRILQPVVRKPVADILALLEQLRDHYYEPIEEMLEAPIPVATAEEAEEDLELAEGLDPLLLQAARIASTRKTISATLLQRKLKVGFARAARIIDQLEELGMVGPQEGSKPRQVLLSYEEFQARLIGRRQDAGPEPEEPRP